MDDVPVAWRRVAAELLDRRQPIRPPGIVGIYSIFVLVSHPCASNRLSTARSAARTWRKVELIEQRAHQAPVFISQSEAAEAGCAVGSVLRLAVIRGLPTSPPKSLSDYGCCSAATPIPHTKGRAFGLTF